MSKHSKNYSLRKYYLENDQVPTQTVMNVTMSPPLAKIYFKSMTPKLKAFAGLEPLLKGGGYDWYVPPKDLLEKRTVLKPLKKEFLKKLGYNGFVSFGDKILELHLESQKEIKRLALLENDNEWKKKIKESYKKEYEELSKKAVQKNSEKIKKAFYEFTVLYISSINKVENLLLHASKNEIDRIKEEAYLKMSSHYKTLLKQQASMLYDRYAEKLERKKEELKEKFISKIEQSRMKLGNKVHDINLEKHVAIEKLRQLLECQNLAYQIYIAMEEKEENEKLLNQSSYDHTKTLKFLSQEINRNDIQIQSKKDKEEKRHRFNRIWKEKICQVVKKFQEFIAYSLHTIPEQADFLLNIEKLLLLQISDTIENPNAESLIESEKEFHTPVAEIQPFYLICDRDSMPHINNELCPNPGGSRTSQLPVMVINKRCIYAACDNLEEFADKVEQFIDVQRTKNSDLNDGHDYSSDVPVKYSPSQQLLDLKEQSSVMKILQKELPNPKNVTLECFCPCKLPFCFCLPSRDPLLIISDQKNEDPVSAMSIPNQNTAKTTNATELVHRREPKWESYFKFMEPKNCKCVKLVKKGLKENLPAYMTKMSAFEYPELPNYEPCSMTTLKKLVRRSKRPKRKVLLKTLEPTTTDVATEYSDQELESLCTCLDEKQALITINQIMEKNGLLSEANTGFYVDGSLSSNQLNKSIESFVNDRALSLGNLIKNSPELVEIFKREHCQIQLKARSHRNS